MNKTFDACMWLLGCGFGVWVGGGSSERIFFSVMGMAIGLLAARIFWVRD
jgi:hypothetical protein